MGRLIDIENIDYVILEDSLHCLEHHKGDEVECVICAPTVEAIPKADYENRLKADLKAILVELQLEFEENTVRWYVGRVDGKSDDVVLMETVNDIIQQKIDKLKDEDNNV